ncbi:MAG: helix-turn-helix transcriptional regulator, partial [Bacteroidota bacterium]
LMSMGERLGALIKALGISKAQFAKSIENSASRISNITTGRSKPDSPMLAKILEVYPNANIQWILSGEGEPLASSKKATKASAAPVTSGSAAPAASALSSAEVQDLRLLQQKLEYLERENALLKTFLGDLRSLTPHLSAATEPAQAE